MKLISLNVGLFEKNNRKIKEFLVEQEPDIVCLQEVTRRIDRETDDELVTYDPIIAATPELTEGFYAPVWILKDFRQYNFHGKDEFVQELGGWAEFGLMIKTRYEIVSGKTVYVKGELTKRTDWHDWPENDNRAVQVTDILINDKKLRLINYHGIWSKGKMGDRETVDANNKILGLVKEVSYPSIVCGDFNLFPNTESMKVLSEELESLVDSYNIENTRPKNNELSGETRNVVDYVLITNGIRVSKLQVPDVDVSDHLPLILNFELDN